MGSYDAAVMSGFVCRLCSELSRNVIHIYSDKGKQLKLEEKINMMPISVEIEDSLPKTICSNCIKQLDSQYELIQNIRKNRKKIIEHARRARLLSEQQSVQQQDVSTVEETERETRDSDTCAASSSNSHP